VKGQDSVVRFPELTQIAAHLAAAHGNQDDLLGPDAVVDELSPAFVQEEKRIDEGDIARLKIHFLLRAFSTAVRMASAASFL